MSQFSVYKICYLKIETFFGILVQCVLHRVTLWFLLVTEHDLLFLVQVVSAFNQGQFQRQQSLVRVVDPSSSRWRLSCLQFDKVTRKGELISHSGCAKKLNCCLTIHSSTMPTTSPSRRAWACNTIYTVSHQYRPIIKKESNCDKMHEYYSS